MLFDFYYILHTRYLKWRIAILRKHIVKVQWEIFDYLKTVDEATRKKDQVLLKFLNTLEEKSLKQLLHSLKKERILQTVKRWLN